MAEARPGGVAFPPEAGEAAPESDDSLAAILARAVDDPPPAAGAAQSRLEAESRANLRTLEDLPETPAFLANLRTLEDIPLRPGEGREAKLSAAEMRTLEDFPPPSAAELRTLEDLPLRPAAVAVSAAEMRTLEDFPAQSAADMRTLEDFPAQSAADMRTLEDLPLRSDAEARTLADAPPGPAADMRTIAYPEGGFTPDHAKARWGGTVAEQGNGLTLKTGDAHRESSIFMAISNTVRLRSSRLAAGAELGGGDFMLTRLLGKGGMGMVFTARQSSLNRNVAIKVIRPESVSDAVAKAKFVTEAVLTGGLDHPNIIPIHELGQTDDGGVFYAMKEVKGRGWNDRLAAMSESENVGVLLRVADAIAFAHDNGIIHRDLKPENVMLGDYGEVLVMDWGIAVPYRPDADGNRPSMGTAGTPAYMAPEMANGDDARMGPATDVYLLGAILYEIAAGVRAHSGGNIYDCLANAANNVITPTDRTGELVAIALKAMATDPADRFASVKEFQEALLNRQRHQESELLARRAAESLAEAGRGGLYAHFSKSVFGFEEALVLWPENAEALAGRREARLAYAGRAIAQGDCDLALETLEPLPEADARRGELRRAAAEAKRQIEEQRLARRRWQRAAAALVCLVLVTLTAGILLVHNQMLTAQSEGEKARAAERGALASQAEAVRQRDEAEIQRGLANDNEILARRSAALAAEEAENARQAEAEALRQKDAAQLARDAAQRSRDEAVLAQRATELARQAENEANQRTIAALRQREEEEKLRLQAQEEARQRTEEAARLGVLTDASLWAVDAAAAAARQEEGARAAGRPASLTVRLEGAAPLVFRWLPVGEVVNGNTFVMGSPPAEAGRHADEFLHPVTLTRPVYLAVTEFTRGQWKAVLGDESAEELEADRLLVQAGAEEWRNAWLWRTRPLPEGEADLPATGVSVRDVLDRLLPALAKLAPAGHAFRLPSEAEWECAARAGTITPFAFGSDSRAAGEMAWTLANSGEHPHPAGRLKPNAWGFHDMHGNVSEMTADLYSRDFYRAGGLLPDPVNAGQGRRHVARGGAYLLTAAFARSAARAECHEANRFNILGVRLALAPDAPPAGAE